MGKVDTLHKGNHTPDATKGHPWCRKIYTGVPEIRETPKTYLQMPGDADKKNGLHPVVTDKQGAQFQAQVVFFL